MAKNSANRNFHYKNPAAGTYTIKATVALRPEGEERSCPSWPLAEWSSGFEATQSITIGGTVENASSTPPSGNAAEEGGSEAAPPSPPATQGSNTVSYKPQISVSALVPSRGIVGAPVLFDATAIGLKKEPLMSARYTWSFGDGGFGEGKKIVHTYHYPAVYVVMVDASSGEWSASDRKEIVIAQPELRISTVKEGGDGFIELRNGGADEVDLSNWQLRSGTRTFSIPEGTRIGAQKAVPFPALITNISADSRSTTLLYPNGDTVTKYEERPAAPPPAPVKKAEEQATQTGAAKKETLRKETIPPSPPVPPADEDARSLPPELSPTASSTPLSQVRELIGAAGASQTVGAMPWLLALGLFLAVSIGGGISKVRPEKEESAAEKLQKEAAEFEIEK